MSLYHTRSGRQFGRDADNSSFGGSSDSSVDRKLNNNEGKITSTRQMANRGQNDDDEFNMADYIQQFIDFISPGFSLGFFAVFLLLTATVDQPKFPTAMAVVAYFVLMMWYRKVEFTIQKYGAWKVVGFIFAYMIIGIIWAVIKFWTYIRQDDVIAELVAQGLNANNIDSNIITQFVVTRYDIYYQWALYWPLSVPMTFFNQFIRQIVYEAFYRLQGVFESMVTHVVKTRITQRTDL